MTKSIVWRIEKFADKKSKYHAGNYTQITFLDELTGDIAVTNVDESNNNHTYWQQVLAALNQENDVWVDNLHYKTQHGAVVQDKYTNQPVIDADSKPNIVKQQLTVAAQQNQQSQIQFNQQQLHLVAETFEQDRAGKWIVSDYIDKNGEFDIDLRLNSSDPADTIRTKLKIQSLIRYAQALNLGLYR